jgi:dipeptidyl-peptidase-4
VAVTRRPDVFRCGVARAAVTDWAALPAAFAERYLGRLVDSPDVYAHHDLTPDLPAPDLLVGTRPLPEELAFIRGRLP